MEKGEGVEVSEVNEILVDALKEYRNASNWHWTGDHWMWNGPLSGSFVGDPEQHPTRSPDQSIVSLECGSIAEEAIAKAEGR